MEYNEFQLNSAELSPARIKELLAQADAWAIEIVLEKATQDDPNRASVPATTTALHAASASGRLNILTFPGGYVFDHLVHTYGHIEDSTIERFMLEEAGSEGEYQLTTTGILKDTMPLIRGDRLEDPRARHLIKRVEKSYSDSLRPAKSDSIRRFMEILEVARYGNVQFDFEDFYLEFKAHGDTTEEDSEN